MRPSKASGLYFNLLIIAGSKEIENEKRRCRDEDVSRQWVYGVQKLDE